MQKKGDLINWDVKKDDKIEYFDPELSYELTGYRPINKTKGLNFKPELFREAAINKLQTGKYCNDPEESRGASIFWQEEYRRIKEGLTINGYTITGHNYFYINYYTLGSGKAQYDEKTGKATLVEGIADFYVSQYIYFHYLEMCELLEKDVVFLKSRGIGASEMAVSIVANTYTHLPRSQSFLTASLENPFLSDLWNKLEIELSYLNTQTENAFKRLRQKQNKKFSVRASIIENNEEVGHLAQIDAQTVDNPNKIRGGRKKYVFFEEAGYYPKLLKSWQVAEALVYVDTYKIGTRIAFGTGGSEGDAVIGLDAMTYDPNQYNILPYRHTYNKKKEVQYTSFFMPCWVNNKVLMDSRGYVNREDGENYDYIKHRKKLTSPKALSNRCAEYCWYPSEALSKKGDNRFNQELIQEQIVNIKDLDNGVPIIEGDLHYVYENGIISGVRWVDIKGGKIKRTAELPILKDKNNKPFLQHRPLYIAGIDSIDKGVDDSVVGERGSELCIVVKKRLYGRLGNEYVCYYKDRPKTVSDAWNTALKILIYYNCAANLEDTKTSIKGHFRKYKQIHRLIPKPRIAQSDITRYQTSNAIGTPASTKMINHALDLIEDYVEFNCNKIYFLELLEQLKDYSFKHKGKYDMIAAMGMAEIYDQEIEEFTPLTKETTFEYKPLRWFTDDRGRRVYGVQEKKKELKSEFEGYGFTFER